MRRTLAAGAAVVLSLVLLPPSPAAADARSDAQSRANRAAARLATAETDLARAERALAELERETEVTRSRLRELEREVRALAVRQYIRGGAPMLQHFDGDLGQAARGQALARYVALGRMDAVDAYRVAQDDLASSRAATQQQVAERAKALRALEKQRAAAYAELERIAEAERREAARIAAERAAAAKRAAVLAASSRSAGAPRRSSTPTTAAPARTAPSSEPRTMGSGEWICPVQGPRSFSDDWGQPRSGGRRHQGNDILSPRGTPVVASVSGVVKHHNSRLGGLSYYLRGDDGNVYFGTHLSAYRASGRVAAGTVIGLVGDSGNARGTPHLHFEIHPGGGAPVNPYPTLRKHC